MSRDRVLLIDADEVFRQLLQESLASYGVSIIQLSEAGELDAQPQLAESAAVILIGVDLPEKAGFRYFTRVRALAPRVPTVLVTATLSAEEFSLHAKLRLHADLYLDKRLLNQEILCQALAPLVPELIPVQDVERAITSTESGRPMGVGGDEQTRWLVREVSSEGLAALSAAFPDEGDDPGGELTPARFARLKAQVEQLRQELEDSRRAAQSSPFSDDYRGLSETVSLQEAELAHLRLEVGRRDAELAELLGQSEVLTSERAAAQSTADEAANAVEGLFRRAEQAEKQALRLERTFQEQSEAHAAAQVELEGLRRAGAVQRNDERERDAALIERLRDSAERAHAGHERAIEELRREHERDTVRLCEASELELQSALQQAEARLAGAVEEARVEADARLADEQRARARETSELRSSFEAKLESLKRKHAEALDAQRFEAERLRSRAVEAARTDVLSRVAKLERSHEKAMAVLQKAHGQSLDELKRTLESESQKHIHDLAAARSEFERMRGETARAHEEAVAALRRENQSALVAAQAEAERTLAKRVREVVAEGESALAQARERAEASFAETRRSEATELETLASQHHDQIAALENKCAADRARYERTVEERCNEAAQAEREAGDARLDDARRAHEQIVATLEHSHAEELRSLREEHSSARAVEQRNTESVQRESAAQAERRSSEHEGLQAELERVRAEAERLEQKLDKSRSELAARDSLLQARELDLASGRETLVSVRAVLDDIHRAIDANDGDPSAAEAAASLLRSIALTLASGDRESDGS